MAERAYRNIRESLLEEGAAIPLRFFGKPKYFVWHTDLKTEPGFGLHFRTWLPKEGFQAWLQDHGLELK